VNSIRPRTALRLIPAGLALCLLAWIGCKAAQDGFATGLEDDDDLMPGPGDDDTTPPGDDDATPPADDDSADTDDDDDSSEAGDDDDSACGDDDDSAACDFTCGVIYRPQGGYDTDAPTIAACTDVGLGADPDPVRVRASYHDDPSTCLSVQWETDLCTTAGVIDWGTVYPGDNRRVASTFVLGPEGGDRTRVHEARLCDLAPGVPIRYRVGIDGAFSDTYDYTPPDPAAEFLTFVAGGDSRNGCDTLADLVALAMPYGPELFVHTGDMVNGGSWIPDWTDYYDAVPEFATMPVVSVHGNHEGLSEEFFGMVASPDNEEWFSLEIGPLYLAVLNDSRDLQTIEDQAIWLDQDLAQTSATFKAVACHQPVYSSGSHGSTTNLQGKIAPVLDTHGVHLVFSGHDHGYERSLPLRADAVVDNPADGTTYVTTGGAGALLYSFTGDWFTAYTEAEFHICIIEITDRVLTMTTIRQDGTLMDEFVLDLDG